MTCQTCDGSHECKCEQERIAAALERIAAALEALKPTVTYNTSPSAGSGGYQCMTCFSWVNPGVFHSCNSSFPRSVITLVPNTVTARPTYSVDPSKCTYVTAAGMQCTLEPQHYCPHDLGV